MSRWLPATLFCLGTCFGLPSLAAAQQVGNEVNTGINGHGDSMFGPHIDIVNGTNANGTPRQMLPGASMTNGAGNSTMTPGITGGPNAPITGPSTLPQGITVPTLNGHTTIPGE